MCSSDLISKASEFDEFCVSNIEWIGANFFAEIANYFGLPSERREASLRSIFTSAYRFVCELEFANPVAPNFQIRSVMAYVQAHLDDFSGVDRQQLIFAAFTMPAQVAKRLINHPSIGDFRKFADTVESSRKLREDWDADIKRREDRLHALDQNLNKIESAYNFVGLVSGFQGLRRSKEDERKFALNWLAVISVLMVAIPVAQIGFVVSKLGIIDSYKLALTYMLPTVVAVELVVLYFFRVVLGHFRSVKAQLLQLDLRIALCQFIESYAEYAARAKAQDPSALAKFEALVFSGLPNDENGIPSTFDGADQLANLFRSFRGASGKA